MIRVITLRTGQLRRVSDHEIELAIIGARRIVEDVGPERADMLDDKERLALALIALVDNP